MTIVRRFKALAVSMGAFVSLWIAAWIFFPGFITGLECRSILGAGAEYVLFYLNIIFTVIFFAFLYYLHRTAALLKANGIIGAPPILLTILQFILTPVTFFMIIPGFIIPAYLWIKSRRLGDVPFPEAQKAAGEADLGRKAKTAMGILLVVASVIAGLFLITMGLYAVLWAYDVGRELSTIFYYLAALLFVTLIGIFGYRLIRMGR